MSELFPDCRQCFNLGEDCMFCAIAMLRNSAPPEPEPAHCPTCKQRIYVSSPALKQTEE